MDPGPANMGIESGVKAISFRCWASDATFLLTPLFLLKLPVSNEKPELTMIIPPAILSASILIPKKLSTYSPIKKEMMRMIKTLMAVQIEILERSA